MVLFQKFREIVKKNSWHNKRLLLAISGGVDSMVLLDLFLNLPADERPQIGIAHVNHGVRTSSKKEESYLATRCEELSLPFYNFQWQAGKATESNFEAEARKIRYTFFQEIVAREKYQAVVTAHHKSDQTETFLLKIIRGTQLQNLVGITESRYLGELLVYRPLLSFSKKEIEQYAHDKKITFFEDETNQQALYLRNRIRHKVVPLLKEENPKVEQHVANLTKQIGYANKIISQKIEAIWSDVIGETDNLIIKVSSFQKLTAELQYMFLVEYFQKKLIDCDEKINEEQLQIILNILNNQAPQKKISLTENIFFQRIYDQAKIVYQEQEEVSVPTQTLSPGETLQLAKKEFLRLDMIKKEEIALELLKDNQLIFEARAEDLPLIIRKREPGDRIVLDKSGQRKKVARILIDQKIALSEREKARVVTTKKGRILWLLPYRQSYLSIGSETDKIHYKLTYLKS